jgi:flagellar assembly protein FliH
MSSSKILKGQDPKSSSVSSYSAQEMHARGRRGKTEEARKDADEIIRQARALKESIEMEAYREGIKKGQEEGRKMAIKKIDPLFDTLRNALAEIADIRPSIVEKSQDQIMEIIFLIAEKVIHRQVQISPDIVLETVRAASNHLMETEEIRLHLHPSDFEYVREIENILSRKLSSRKNIHIVEDSTIDRGGIIIETEFGDIDATIGPRSST